MSPAAIVIILFVVGILFLIAEIFIPSYGILSLAGLGFLGMAIYKAYSELSPAAGHTAVFAAGVMVPTLAVIAIKTFHRTPWGKKISPPNPTVSSEEYAPQYAAMKKYIGQTGRTLTPLRPVGTCTFNGQRVNCVAESGMIDRDVEVDAIGLRGQEIEVRPRTSA